MVCSVTVTFFSKILYYRLQSSQKPAHLSPGGNEAGPGGRGGGAEGRQGVRAAATADRPWAPCPEGRACGFLLFSR